MANIKGVYKKISLQQILDKLENIEYNEYKEIKIEFTEEGTGHYIYENNNELTIFLSKEYLTTEEKNVYIEIRNKVLEYNKQMKEETKVENTDNYSKEEQDDLDEYSMQFRVLKEIVKSCKKDGKLIDIKFTNESSFDGMPIKGKYIVINGTSLNIDKIRSSPEFDWIINNYIPKYNEEIKFKNSNSTINKIENFKESLKCNIEQKKKENEPKKEERKTKIKGNLKNVAKTLERGCKYVSSIYNKINKGTKKKAVAIILSVTALYSAGSIGYDIGRANEYVDGQGFESVEDAIDYLQENRRKEVEKGIEQDLGQGVEVIARQYLDTKGASVTSVGVKSGYDRYSIPNELEEILEDIAVDAQSDIGKKLKLSKLLELQGKIEKYFSKCGLVVKERSLGNDKLVEKKNIDDTSLEK